MFKRFSFFALVTAMTIGAGAAIAVPPKNTSNSNRQGPIATLNLNDTQKTQVQNIQNKYKPQIEQNRTQLQTERETMKTLMSNPNSSNSQLQSQHNKIANLVQTMENLRFQQMLEIRAVLTPEQRTKLAQAMSGKRNELRNNAPRANTQNR